MLDAKGGMPCPKPIERRLLPAHAAYTSPKLPSFELVTKRGVGETVTRSPSPERRFDVLDRIGGAASTPRDDGENDSGACAEFMPYHGSTQAIHPIACVSDGGEWSGHSRFTAHGSSRNGDASTRDKMSPP
jgi:hypothetical protein